MLVDLTTQLDKTQRLLGQLLAAKSGTRSEQLSADELRLFAQELGTELPTAQRKRRPIPHRMTIFRPALARAVAMRIKPARADDVPCRLI